MNDKKIDRFSKGLLEYNLTLDEIITSGWKYCGGDTGRHAKYFKISCPNDIRPEHTNNCVCGHFIKRNCYITNAAETDIIILGSCCIKKFIPKEKSGRTCKNCGMSHKNRKYDLCNNCKPSSCIKKIPKTISSVHRFKEIMHEELDETVLYDWVNDDGQKAISCGNFYTQYKRWCAQNGEEMWGDLKIK